MTVTARRIALIAATATATVLGACTNPVAPVSRSAATIQAQMDGGFMGSVGKDSTP